MASSLAQSAQRIMDSQPLLPLDLSYSALYGIYTGASSLHCSLNCPTPSSFPLKVDMQDVENNVPLLYNRTEPVTSSALNLFENSMVVQNTELNHHNACDSDGSSSTVSTSCSKSKSSSEKRKKELIRDQAYWERRRKNNDAAKRSRDSRRRKEDEVAVRAALLEQENLRLRFEVERLKMEIERHRLVAINPKLVLGAFEPWTERASVLQSTN